MSLKTIINKCEVCKNNYLYQVLDLGKSPLCDDLIKIGSKKKNINYKIKILFCRNCFTAHQKYQVNKKRLFPLNYHYRAKFTEDVTEGMKDIVNDCHDLLGSLKNKTILDIGCNDGSLLNFFKKKRALTIGVEPTNASKDARLNGHKIYSDFFNLKLAKKIKKKYKKIDIITFTNVFAHIENLQNLLNSLKKLISDKTIIIIENHYLNSIIDKMQFDTFYHEHPRTYSLNSFIFIGKILNLNILKFKFTKRYGGNIRVIFSKSKYNNTKKLNKILIKENMIFSKFKKLPKKISIWKKNKIKQLEKIKKIYKDIPAKAFPGRAAILIKILNIDEKLISAVYEKPNSPKIGNYVPGTKIPIKNENIFFKNIENKKIVLNLAWHIPKEIKKYLEKKGFKGKIVNIIEKKDL